MNKICCVLIAVVGFWSGWGRFVSDAAAAELQAGEGLLPVGVARVDITPDGPIRLCGYAVRQKESEGVAERIWAKALAIGSDAEGLCVVVTAEVVGVPAALVERLAERLQRRIGLPRARLAVCTTHTHTGPCVAGVAPHIFAAPLPPDQRARGDRYTQQLAERLEQVVVDAVADRKPARLLFGQGRVDFAMNRRAIRDGRWAGMRRNPDGPVDHALPMLAARAPNGKLRAVLVNYACHCTTYGPGFNKIHGDWAGSAARMIEQAHAGAVALVAIGCGADANPQPRGAASGSEMVDRHGRAIADEVERLLAGRLRPVHTPAVCRFRYMKLPLDHVPDRTELQARLKGPKRTAYYARLLLKRLDRGEKLPGSFPYPIQTWRFGDELIMVFLAGEVVVDYAMRLKKLFGPDRTWVTAYANDAPCYIASARVIREGGYEVDESMNTYDKPSRLSVSAEDLIIQTVCELLGEAK